MAQALILGEKTLFIQGAGRACVCCVVERAQGLAPSGPPAQAQVRFCAFYFVLTLEDYPNFKIVQGLPNVFKKFLLSNIAGRFHGNCYLYLYYD